MKSAEILSNTDRTCWSRVVMVGRYFWPSIKTKVILMTIISFLIVVTASMLGLGDGKPAGTGMMNLLSLIIVFSPLLFTVRASDEAFYSLPALGYEKCEFIFLFSLVVMPLLATVPGGIYMSIVRPGFTGEMLLNTLVGDLINPEAIRWYGIGSFFSSFAAIAAGLWTAFATRRNRALWTTLGIVGVMLIDGMMGFVVGFIAGMNSTPSDVTTAADSMVNNMNRPELYLPFAGFWILFFIFNLWKASRAISRKQV